MYGTADLELRTSIQEYCNHQNGYAITTVELNELNNYKLSDASKSHYLFLLCLTARQHWIGQFVPTAGG